MRRTINDVLSKSVPSAQQAAGADRQKWRVYNILDMNVVPINVHALMRDVPLINLMNYSYSFEEMTDRFLRKKWRARPGYSGQIVYPEDLIQEMIKDPYMKLDGTSYYTLLNRAVVGDTSMNSRRPKFLSDQLWNKALLNEQYFKHGERKLQSAYGVAGDRGVGHEDNKEGYLVDVQGPIADTVQARGVVNADAPSTAVEALTTAKRRGAQMNYLSYPGFNQGTSRDVAKWVDVKSDRDSAGAGSGTKPAIYINGRVRSTTALIRNMMLVT